MTPTLALAMELVRRPSVTPVDAGCQEVVAERLARLGFALERLRYGQVDNLWARRGRDGPLLCFAGHTDVVPAGPAGDWRSPAFAPELRDGSLFGRGTADMKGSIAAMVTACERFLAAHPEPRGAIAFLLTSDEEGPAVDGTVQVIRRLAERGERIDWCLVGEPSSEERLGDVVKNGRRGSLNGWLTVHGVQGHVAYPERAANPIHLFAPALQELCARTWDRGSASFPPTGFQVSNLRGGTGAENVIPGRLEAVINFRFSPTVTEAELRAAVEETLTRHGLRWEIDWRLSGNPFLTAGGRLLAAVGDAVDAVVGLRPRPSTGGGTSDGRFIAPTGAEVVELGPLSRTIHQVNECVGLQDLEDLSRIYEGVLQRLLL